MNDQTKADRALVATVWGNMTGNDPENLVMGTDEWRLHLAIVERVRKMALADALESLTDIRDQCRNAERLGATGAGFYEDIEDACVAAIKKLERR
jgi:hypothetical protein